MFLCFYALCFIMLSLCLFNPASQLPYINKLSWMYMSHNRIYTSMISWSFIHPENWLRTFKPRLHQGNMLLEATCCRQQNCCQFVVRLLLDTNGYMSPRYRQKATCCRATCLLPATCCSSWCKRGLIIFFLFTTLLSRSLVFVLQIQAITWSSLPTLNLVARWS